MSGSIDGVNNFTGMIDDARTIAGAAISPPTNDKNPRLVFCNLTSPLRWTRWIIFGLRQRGE